MLSAASLVSNDRCIKLFPVKAACVLMAKCCNANENTKILPVK